jgi:hypothetical protein
MFDLGAVEQAGRDQPADAGDRIGPARIAAAEHHVAPQLHRQPRGGGGATHVFDEGRAQEGFRAELHVVAVAGDEDPAHLRGAHAVGQARGQEGAGLTPT